VKCPKCDYLGFESGDRCRNCGYEFSLMGDGPIEAAAADLELRRETDAPAAAGDWLAEIEAQYPLASDAPVSLESPPSAVVPRAVRRAPAPAPETRLPLFTTGSLETPNQPFITLSAAPRPPLGVRRAADATRLRAVPKAVRPASPVPALAFDEEGRAAGVGLTEAGQARASEDADRAVHVGGSGRRAGAALLDLVILGGIDLVVVYLTVRMTALSLEAWTTLPLVPLLGFLAMVKVAYFAAFTAVGGQTIGKMAAGIRVVSSKGDPVDAVSALRRTLVAAASAACLGLGFAPALFDSQRRGLHDRAARTRVVLTSA
jgi:uncharacterized RDD family membrane protein YckC